MYISMPEKFFVPIVFVNNFFEDSTSSNIEEEKSENRYSDFRYSNSMYRNEQEEEIPMPMGSLEGGSLEEKIASIEDMGLQYYLVRYLDSLIAILRELEAEDCSVPQNDYTAVLNSNFREFIEIYEEYNNLISNMEKEISSEDLEDMVEYFSNKFRRLYESSLEFLDCPREGYERMASLIDEVVLGIENEIRANAEAFNLEMTNREVSKEYTRNYSSIYK